MSDFPIGGYESAVMGVVVAVAALAANDMASLSLINGRLMMTM